MRDDGSHGGASDATTSDAERASQGPTPEVVRVLVANHARFLAFLERRVSREAAEEILQDAFVRSLARGSDLRDDESAVAWFFRALRNALVDHYRRRDAERRALESAANDPEIAKAVADPELHDVACQCVASLVETLDAKQGEALRKVDLEGMSVQGYAAEAGITPSNAGVRLHRARESLRKHVAASCGTCAKHGCVDCTCRAAASRTSGPRIVR